MENNVESVHLLERMNVVWTFSHEVRETTLPPPLGLVASYVWKMLALSMDSSHILDSPALLWQIPWCVLGIGNLLSYLSFVQARKERQRMPYRRLI